MCQQVNVYRRGGRTRRKEGEEGEEGEERRERDRGRKVSKNRRGNRKEKNQVKILERKKKMIGRSEKYEGIVERK